VQYSIQALALLRLRRTRGAQALSLSGGRGLVRRAFLISLAFFSRHGEVGGV
jgi:hypothetical protein